MLALNGIYHNGKLILEKEIASDKPIKVIVTFVEESLTEEKDALQLNQFSFMEARRLLKDYKGSFADEVTEERREEI